MFLIYNHINYFGGLNTMMIGLLFISALHSALLQWCAKYSYWEVCTCVDVFIYTIRARTPKSSMFNSTRISYQASLRGVRDYFSNLIRSLKCLIINYTFTQAI